MPISLFAFLLSCLFVFLSFCLSVLLSFCPFVFLSFCLSVFLSFLSGQLKHHIFKYKYQMILFNIKGSLSFDNQSLSGIKENGVARPENGHIWVSCRSEYLWIFRNICWSEYLDCLSRWRGQGWSRPSRLTLCFWHSLPEKKNCVIPKIMGAIFDGNFPSWIPPNNSDEDIYLFRAWKK